MLRTLYCQNYIATLSVADLKLKVTEFYLVYSSTENNEQTTRHQSYNH